MKNHAGLKDFLRFAIIAIAILAFSSIPYWVGNTVETDELLFRGTYFNSADYAVHISMMQAGRMGDWAYQIRFTIEKIQPAFVRMFYIILGHASKWINLDVESTFQTARWIFGFLALFSIHQLCQKVFPSKASALAAFLLAVMGAGAGWLQLMLGAPLEPISPIDFWLIDAYTFFSISLFPSFSFTLILMTTALNLYLDYLDTGKWSTIILVSLLAGISQITNPIAFAVIDIAFVCAAVFRWWKNNTIKLQQLHALILIAMVQIPLLVYNLFILGRDPIWSQFTLQNQTLSPPPIFYMWGFAPFWLFAIWGMINAFRERNPAMAAMSAWVICGFALAYLPVLIQRRFLLGITIPLGILAIYGLSHLLNYLSIRARGFAQRKSLIYFTYILLASVSSIYLVLGSSLYMQTRPSGNFYPRDLENALAWLDQNAAPNDFALGAVETGQLIAQRTRLKTYIGHPMETLFFDDKLTKIEAFYKGRAPNNWIQQTPIQWVIYSKYEKEIASSFIPGPNLELVYQNKTVTIYKVKQ